MTGEIEKIPAEVRWAIATKGLTGAFTAIAGAFKDALGEERYNSFNAGLWYMGGKGAKEFADAFGLKAETPKDIAEAYTLMVLASMGPEFEYEIVEPTADRCVIKSTKCPWRERGKELGVDWDYCTSGHQKWGDGVVESLNPSFGHSLNKNMQAGDPYCEWVIERKK